MRAEQKCPVTTKAADMVIQAILVEGTGLVAEVICRVQNVQQQIHLESKNSILKIYLCFYANRHGLSLKYTHARSSIQCKKKRQGKIIVVNLMNDGSSAPKLWLIWAATILFHNPPHSHRSSTFAGP